MAINHLVRNALIASSLLATTFAGAAHAQNSDKDLAAAVQEVTKLEADLSKPGADREASTWDKVIDVHGSGWIYTKQERLGPAFAAERKKTTKVIKSERTQYQIVASNKDTVIENYLTTVYYEVPDPEEEAKAAGVFLYEPAALATAAKERVDSAMPPGDGPSPNPYRIRTTRVWSRINGKWQLVVTVGSTVRQRVVSGRF